MYLVMNSLHSPVTWCAWETGVTVSVVQSSQRIRSHGVEALPSWSRGKLPLSGGFGRRAFWRFIQTSTSAYCRRHVIHSMAFEGFVDYDFTMGLVGGCSSDEEESAGPVAVNHSFGRGQFKEMAEKFVIPEPVLEDIIKRSGKSSWSDSTCGVGGATTKMGGVRGARPKGVGRARALKMRAERPPLPHPGQRDIAVSNSNLLFVMHAQCV